MSLTLKKRARDKQTNNIKLNIQKHSQASEITAVIITWQIVGYNMMRTDTLSTQIPFTVLFVDD